MDKPEYHERLRAVLEKCLVDKDETIESLEKEVDELVDENRRLKEDLDVCERTIKTLTIKLDRVQYDTYPA